MASAYSRGLVGVVSLPLKFNSGTRARTNLHQPTPRIRDMPHAPELFLQKQTRVTPITITQTY